MFNNDETLILIIFYEKTTKGRERISVFQWNIGYWRLNIYITLIKNYTAFLTFSSKVIQLNELFKHLNSNKR